MRFVYCSSNRFWSTTSLYHLAHGTFSRLSWKAWALTHLALGVFGPFIRSFPLVISNIWPNASMLSTNHSDISYVEFQTMTTNTRSTFIVLPIQGDSEPRPYLELCSLLFSRVEQHPINRLSSLLVNRNVHLKNEKWNILRGLCMDFAIMSTVTARARPNEVHVGRSSQGLLQMTPKKVPAWAPRGPLFWILKNC
jgi:hypothetical protein